MKSFLYVCFYIPIFLNVLNVQAFLSRFISANLAQAFAYGAVGLMLIGTISLLKEKGPWNLILRTWLFYYSCYFGFGLLANVIHGNDVQLLKSLIILIYFIGFSTLLSVQEHRIPIAKTIGIGLFISCIFTIIFHSLNFSLDVSGIYEYKLERAGGVYGDANNAALASILSFIFIHYFFTPKTILGRIVKNCALLISCYALILAFSKTGFLIFAIVLGLFFHKWFTFKRLIFTAFLLPTFVIGVFQWGLNSSSVSKEQKARLESLVNIVTLQTDKIDFSNRDVLLKNMLNYVYENPFIGNGINFSVEIRGHNTLIGVWADAGIFTFIIFLILLFLYYKESFLTQGKVKFLSFSILITLCTYMLSLQTVINQGYIMAILVLLSYLLYDINSQKQLEKQN